MLGNTPGAAFRRSVTNSATRRCPAFPQSAALARTRKEEGLRGYATHTGVTIITGDPSPLSPRYFCSAPEPHDAGLHTESTLAAGHLNGRHPRQRVVGSSPYSNESKTSPPAFRTRSASSGVVGVCNCGVNECTPVLPRRQYSACESPTLALTNTLPMSTATTQLQASSALRLSLPRAAVSAYARSVPTNAAAIRAFSSAPRAAAKQCVSPLDRSPQGVRLPSASIRSSSSSRCTKSGSHCFAKAAAPLPRTPSKTPKKARRGRLDGRTPAPAASRWWAVTRRRAYGCDASASGRSAGVASSVRHAACRS
eukprot:Hpha_TRINITY_DN31273_c0_g1::TRINITY_DN31273_c0_g1_i1::g.2428::m.2428